MPGKIVLRSIRNWPGRIDWTRSTNSIYNLIRGLSPFPAAFTHLDEVAEDAWPALVAAARFDAMKQTRLSATRSTSG